MLPLALGPQEKVGSLLLILQAPCTGRGTFWGQGLVRAGAGTGSSVEAGGIISGGTCHLHQDPFLRRKLLGDPRELGCLQPQKLLPKIQPRAPNGLF